MRNTWFGVEMRHLAALAALGDEGSFRRAAESLGYVQSAVSQQLAHLEQLLEVRLVERQRGRGSIHLTEAGTLLLEHSRDILARFDAARADFDLLREGRAGRLRVGVSEPVAARLLPQIVARFRRQAPDLVLEITEAIAEETLWEMLESGRVDAALCGVPPVDGPFEWIELLEDPYVLVAAAGSTVAASSEPLGPERLSRLPLIDHRLMRQVEAQLEPSGFQPRYVFRSDLYTTVQALVAGGVGTAILPQLAVNPLDEAVCALPLDVLHARAVAICWHGKRHLSPGLELLAETARGVCAPHRKAAPPLQLAS